MIHKQWLRVQCLDLSNPHDRISSTHLKGLILIVHIVLQEVQCRAIEYALTNMCLLDYCYYTIVKVLVTWTGGCQKFALCHIHISITLNLQCTLNDYSIIHTRMDKADFSPLFSTCTFIASGNSFPQNKDGISEKQNVCIVNKKSSKHSCWNL